MAQQTHPEQPPADLKLLGTPGLSVASPATGAAIGPGKSLALLAYLAVRRSVRREELINLLWGDMPEDQARNAFRQALHRIRKAVGGDLLVSDRDTVALGSADFVRVDRDRFLAACDAERWTEAATAYSGDFLEGFVLDESAFDRWADAERMHLRGRFQGALRLSGEAALAAGDTAAAIHQANRLAASGPYEADAVLFQANVLVAAGKTPEALAALRQFVVRLHAELELAPPAPVQQLVTRLERSTEAQSGKLHGAGAPERRAIPFLGRDAELARLLSGVAVARAERGSTFVIEAEGGMGRTRLLDELRARIRDLGGVMVLRGQERATTSVVPYAAIAEALRPLARASGISGASRHLLAEAARLLPELRDSFELPELGPVEDPAGRLRFFEGVAATIEAAAYERPLCILLDDVHHASPPSLDLLAYLTGRLRTSPVMFVLSARSDRPVVVDRLHAMAQTSDDHSADFILALGPLSADDTRRLVAPVMAASDSTAADVERVVRQSSGRPLLAIDLARRASSGESPSEAPALMRDVLWARLQASPPSQRRVFFAAALLERVAPIRLLAAAAHLPEAATLEAVVELSQAGLLRDAGDGYVVAHDSTIGFVGDASGIAGRALLAGWAADALAAEQSGVDAELSHLYAMAGRAPLAFTHARAAAFAAAAVGANAEATHHLTVALSFAPDEKARAQIESLLSVYGHGALRLTGETVADAPPVDDAVADEEVVVVEVDGDAVVTEIADDATPRRSTPSSAEPVPAPRRVSAHQWYMSIALSAIVVLLGVLVRRQLTQPSLRPARADSVVVVRRDPASGTVASFALSPNDPKADPTPRPETTPRIAWLASLPAPWSDPLVSPDGGRVALSQVTSHGKDLYVIAADRRDTVPIVVGGGDNVALGWSPDSRMLLVSRSRTLSDGSYDSDLYAQPARRGGVAVAIDTSSIRSVAEARWSPTGLSVAWVARVGPTRERDVLVARADGNGTRNITSSASDDFGIAWSPDGSLLAFTSTRAGGPRIFTYDFENEKTWPVSDRDGEDHATFSPDGRLLAFEAARDGDAAIYVRPPLGGAARRLTPAGSQYELAGWTTRSPGWIDRVRIFGATTLAVGDSVDLKVLSITADGTPVPGVEPVWSLLASQTPVVDARRDGARGDFRILARREGVVRVVASVPGWRTDTATVIVGSANRGLTDDFSGGLDPSRWSALGEPAPFVGREPGRGGAAVLFPNGDLEWESGVLSKATFSFAAGLSLGARVFAPFAGRASAASLTIGLVAVGAVPDARAPQLQPTIGVSWDGQSGALHYVAGRESFADLAAVRSDAASHDVGIRIARDSTVVFSVDGKDRWRSSLHYGAEAAGTRLQLWMGGRATGTSVAVGRVSLDGAAVRP